MPPQRRDRRTVAPRRTRSAGFLTCLGLASGAALWACSGAPPPPPPTPIDAEGAAQNASLTTRPQEPVRIVFAWSLNESGSRTSGRGVVRMEPPYKARLDLFTGQGETVLRAALVGDVLRLPPGVESQEIVPPPTLLWAALGVFRPGNLAYLSGGEALSEGEIQLNYSLGAGEGLVYRLDGTQVQRVELSRDGHTTESLAVTAASEHPFPQETEYRNLAAFRELTMTLDGYEHVDVFPPDIWLDPVGR